MDIQFILFATGFFILGLAIGDKIVKYFPKKIRNHKGYTTIILFLIGIVVFSIPLKMTFDKYNEMKLDSAFKYLETKLSEIQLSNQSKTIKDQIIKQINKQKEQLEKTKEKYFTLPLKMYGVSAILFGLGMSISYFVSNRKRD